GLASLGFYWWKVQFDHLLITKVNGDLTIARQYFNRIMERDDESLSAVGQSAAFAEILRTGTNQDLSRFLEDQRRRQKLDFLYLTDQEGHVIAAAPSFAQANAPRRWPVVNAALGGKSAAVIDLFATGDLQELSPALAQRARIPLVKTSAATSTDRTEETRGLVVHTATPVKFPDARNG